jgi:hypothetical protein
MSRTGHGGSGPRSVFASSLPIASLASDNGVSQPGRENLWHRSRRADDDARGWLRTTDLSRVSPGISATPSDVSNATPKTGGRVAYAVREKNRTGSSDGQPPRTADRHRLGYSLFLVAAGLSFLLSIGLWFSGNREEGIFVGLWVPSILAAGVLWTTAVARQP